MANRGMANNMKQPPHYEITAAEDGNGYISTCPALPTLSAFGDTPAAALQELEVVLTLAREVYWEESWPWPLPEPEEEV